MRHHHDPGVLPLLILASLLLILATPLAAQEAGPADRPGHGMRLEASTGVHHWEPLSDLKPAANGSFRENGFALGGGAHWLMRDGERMDLLLGIDAYIFSSGSSVTHVTDDVLFRGLQLTPSMKLSFDNGRGPRYLLGFGIGYYEADIAEIGAYGWGPQSELELWKSSAWGWYAGLDIDFPRRKRDSAHGFFMSARIHDIDFGTVRDDDFSIPGFGTLGPDAGELSGPMPMLHFGYQWLR